MNSTSGWRRCAGLVSTATPDAARAEGFLDGAQVIALIESDPDAPFSVAIAIAVDEDRRVAVLSESGTEIVPGPAMEELAEALATDCQALVVLEDLVAEARDDLSDGAEPFGSEIDLASTRLPERAVAITRAPLRDLEDLATEANTELSVLSHNDARVVFVQDGPALTSLQWHDEHLPVVLLERGESFPSLTLITAPGTAHLHSWDSHVSMVPTGADEIVEPFVREKLGAAALVRSLDAAAPGADRSMVEQALQQDGEQGLGTMVSALGLPPLARDFLSGRTDAAQIPEAIELGPMTVGDTVRRAMDEAAVDARAHMDQMREIADGAREQARESARANVEHMRRHAMEASDAAHSFADPQEHPTLAWATPAAGLLQLLGALFALRKALQHGGGPGTRWWGLLAGVLGTAATGNLVLTALPWRKGRRQRV